jgi:hypothetical protein
MGQHRTNSLLGDLFFGVRRALVNQSVVPAPTFFVAFLLRLIDTLVDLSRVVLGVLLELTEIRHASLIPGRWARKLCAGLRLDAA